MALRCEIEIFEADVNLELADSLELQGPWK
jgi:hypothetical protein